MTDLVVRRLLVDLKQPFARHWCGGDAFRTAFFNALSMSFPIGEQFFMDAVRNGHQALPADPQAQLASEVAAFVGQEATHRHIHALFNGHLDRQGLVNHWAPRAQARLKVMQGADPRHALAITAANEHFTAIFAEWMLRNPSMVYSDDQRLQTLWLWHSAEEAEHKSTAFDVYQALGGSLAWRITWFRRITLIFLGDTLRQTLANLRQDKTLWRWNTWRSAAQFLFGTTGLIRQTYKPWRSYLRSDFHPSQQHSDLSQQWLNDNHTQYAAVGSG
jgi:uncharacterized protein